MPVAVRLRNARPTRCLWTFTDIYARPTYIFPLPGASATGSYPQPCRGAFGIVFAHLNTRMAIEPRKGWGKSAAVSPDFEERLLYGQPFRRTKERHQQSFRWPGWDVRGTLISPNSKHEAHTTCMTRGLDIDSPKFYPHFYIQNARAFFQAEAARVCRASRGTAN